VDENSADVQVQIEKACDDFVRNVKAGKNQDLVALVESFPDSYRLELMRRLLPKKMELDYSSGNDDTLLPVEAYLKQLDVFSGPSPKELLLDLVAAEFRLRQQAGELPTIGQTLKRFPDLEKELRPLLRAQLRELSFVFVMQVLDGGSEVSIPLDRTIELGRQRQGEPGPPTQITVSETLTRFILAEESDLRVSRRHASCEQVSMNVVRITNHSKTSIVSIDFEQTIPPDEAWDGPPPFMLTVGPKVLHLGVH